MFKDSYVDCHPFHSWNALYGDTHGGSAYHVLQVFASNIAPLGRLLAAMPVSQAATERVFSAANWQAEGREQISLKRLSRELYIRFNHLALAP